MDLWPGPQALGRGGDPVWPGQPPLVVLGEAPLSWLAHSASCIFEFYSFRKVLLRLKVGTREPGQMGPLNALKEIMQEFCWTGDQLRLVRVMGMGVPPRRNQYGGPVVPGPRVSQPVLPAEPGDTADAESTGPGQGSHTSPGVGHLMAPKGGGLALIRCLVR